MARSLKQTDYQALAEFRFQIRSFLRFSELASRAAGLEPQQQQMLLAIRGWPAAEPPRIGDIAGRLQIQHHSAVELADRLELGGYIVRRGTGNYKAGVRLALTPEGNRVLQKLSLDHRKELSVVGPKLVQTLARVLGPQDRSHSGSERKQS